MRMLRQHPDSLSIIAKFRDKHGLVPTSKLEIFGKNAMPGLRLRAHRDIEVFPHYLLRRVLPLLQANRALWDNAAIDVNTGRAIVGRIPVFGVPLLKAFKEARKSGRQKSRFAILPVNSLSHRGFYADLMLQVHGDLQGDNLESTIEIWQSIQNVRDVYYGHAIASADGATVKHLDCATQRFSEDDKRLLFSKARKRKGESYTKHFRVDGELPLRTALNLMRAYFPVEELTDEAFEVTSWPELLL